ncbi:MAG: UbiD family decarboxylase [Spirochaetaceae bacterium]|jgi:4-hydroxy-3-polyprenylbenzoate decarboxylase|nr:UbiD family decarboxylase [Spirochaetaceae bacterium]
MAYQNLQDFIAVLEKAGELKRIAVPVDPHLEISAIAGRIMKEGGPALLFEQVRGSAYPLAINLMGSERRMAMALNAESLDAKAQEISDIIDWAWSAARDFNPFTTIPQAIPKLPVALSLIPRKKSHPLCQEVVDDDAGFDSLPVLTCWPEDEGPFLTLPLVCTEDPETGGRNIGMYRMQVYDKHTAGMHWHLHKDGAYFFDKYRKRGERMPVAVALGCDPAVIYAATAPLPQGVWEILFAGFLRGRGAEVSKATLSDILVPADAEFVLYM